jgi:NitT/TauT family transport system ATP-binding protein
MAQPDTPPPPPEIVCRAVAKSYGADAAPVEALAPFEATFEAGTTTAIVGPSGCGKSTLLRLVAGLEAPSAGEVLIGGEPPGAVKGRGELAVAFQDPSLLPWRTVESNVALARRLARMRADPRLVQELIGLVGLDGFEGTRPSELSGGMRQRAAIARCMATAPRLVLLDEPFGALDELTRRRLNIELPPIWQRRGATTLLVTHSVVEAALVSDRVIVLSARPGRMVADIPVGFEHPRTGGLLVRDAFQEVVSAIEAALARDAGDALRAAE